MVTVNVATVYLSGFWAVASMGVVVLDFVVCVEQSLSPHGQLLPGQVLLKYFDLPGSHCQHRLFRS